MLIKVTNKCSMGCNHCMENSTPAGEHMPLDMFDQALEFTKRIEQAAYQVGCPPLVLVSGGECSEHPDIIEILDRVEQAGMMPMMITNGMWLEDDDLKSQILKPDRRIYVQVTNDNRFYPTAPPDSDDPRVTRVPNLTLLVPLGRAANRSFKEPQQRKYPSSFNLRSATRALGSFEHAVALQRVRAMGGSSGQCTPSVSENGDVLIGETRFCYKIGTINSTNDELTQAVLEMGSCNRCKLEDQLSMEHKRAIGLTSLYGPGE